MCIAQGKMDCIISESCYKGTILPELYGKNGHLPIHCNSFVKFYGK